MTMNSNSVMLKDCFNRILPYERDAVKYENKKENDF